MTYLFVVVALFLLSCGNAEEKITKRLRSAPISNSTFVIPFEYPLFLQCDPLWANDVMITRTICDVGCLMSSTAMGIAGSNIPIEPSPYISSDPQTLNQWLIENDGYTSSNDLIEEQVPFIDLERIAWPEDAMHRTNDLSYAEISAYLDKGRIVIANVNNGGHFVLLTGYSTTDGDSFMVNDPGFHRDVYSYKIDVVGYRIFDMVRK
jgi:hypothetical protein